MAANTGGTPKNYILVQTMFDKVRERESQLIGVRNGNRFRFFQQKVIGRQTQVTELRWSGWWSYLPSFTTRSY